MRLWTRRKQVTYVFKGFPGGDAHVGPGDTMSVEAWGVTIWVQYGGVFDIRPLMTPEQISERAGREVEAKYGVRIGGGLV